MIKKILPTTDKRLRIKSKPVKKIDKKILNLISTLRQTLISQKNPEGVGLAAPQIGKNLRIFVMKTTKGLETVINPKILKVEKAKDKKRETDRKLMEGCLSLPNFYGPIERAKKIKISYQDEKGNQRVKTFTGIDAQIVQHEIDHLEGILFIDRIIEQGKPLFEYKDGEWEEVEI